MKKVFIMYLFQIISTSVSIAFIELLLLIPLIYIFKENLFNSYVILFIVGLMVVIPLLFFVFCFYWIFQKVTIDTCGVTVTLFGKTITHVEWCEVVRVGYGGHLRNPAIVIEGKYNCLIYLDKRKSIVKAIDEAFTDETRKHDVIHL